MKLLLCKTCQDIVRPLIGIKRICQCGKNSIIGLKDGLTVSYTGKTCIIIGIHNSSLIQAVNNQPTEGMGKEFIAFVLPKKCKTVIEVL